MTRVAASIEARKVLGEDFFGGWDDSDAELFARYARPAAAVSGKITDFLGLRTSTFLHPWAQHYDNLVLGDIPLPDDSLRAEAIEYYATLESLEVAAPGTFKAAELGASYAPWTCVCAELARRTGRTDAHFVAVEASGYLFDLIPVHLSENGFDAQSPTFELINGAVGASRGVLYFPKVISPGENGGQATVQNVEIDYVGRNVEHERVEAYPISEVLGGHIWDLVHIDVQGVEYDVLSAGMDTLNNGVRAIFIGTHSRLIEGQLLELFHSNGWQLKRERPTKFQYYAEKPDVVGWTTRDGGQYWTNPKLRP
jgi:FkbM family methyltransferase